MKETIRKEFLDLTGQEPVIVRSPGRINLIGEHTDYNNGFVLPAAINKEVYFAIRKRDDKHCHIIANDLNQDFLFDLDTNFQSSSVHWQNYFLGILDQLMKRSPPLSSGFDLIFTSNVPIGAGLSSSAAIECGFGTALNEVFQLGLSKKDIALIGQKAEHEFVGVNCGIMDQYACMFGVQDKTFRLDCRSLEHVLQDVNLGDYEIVLIDSKVEHSLASTEYNLRKQECEEAVQFLAKSQPNIQSLRDVTLGMLMDSKEDLDPIVFKRSLFVINENQRVFDSCSALDNNNILDFGKLLFESHKGLSEDYEVSCDETDLLVDLAKENEDVIGSRMMGGGFGGCTINLVKRSNRDNAVASILSNYQKKTGIIAEHYFIKLADGCSVVSL